MSDVAAQSTGLSPKDEMTGDERKRCREYVNQLGYKTALSVVTYPLTFAKTLFQLGHEPYPLSAGKAYLFAGRTVYFLPNVFVYLRQIAQDHGAAVWYSGLDAGVISGAVFSGASFAAELYLDHFFPNVGGILDASLAQKNELHMTQHEAARFHVRRAVRDSITHTVGIVASRPFTVIMIRKIAQLVGGESKYTDVLSSLLRIGADEGPAGFFSGLVPALIADYVFIWVVNTTQFVSERVIEMAKEKNQPEDKEANDTWNFFLKYLVPLSVNGLAYPFHIFSTVMAVSGSGLAVSLLPYAPLFSHWNDAYDYLKPHGLTRGNRVVLREQKGAITVGMDRKLYASNKHFI